MVAVVAEVPLWSLAGADPPIAAVSKLRMGQQNTNSLTGASSCILLTATLFLTPSSFTATGAMTYDDNRSFNLFVAQHYAAGAAGAGAPAADAGKAGGKRTATDRDDHDDEIEKAAAEAAEAAGYRSGPTSPQASGVSQRWGTG